MIGFLLYIVIVGFIVGFLARAVVPGRDSMSIGATIVLGVVGSFIGGFLGYVLFGTDFEEGGFQAAGFVGSLIGAILALLAYRAIGERSDGARRV